MDGQGGSLTDPPQLGPDALEGLLARLGLDPDGSTASRGSSARAT